MEYQQRMETIKAAPPIGISTISMLGVPLNDWVFILTIVYTVLQIAVLLRDKLWKPWRARRANAQKSKGQA